MNSRERNVSLDVARCLLMFGVVLQHTFALCNGVSGNPVVPYATYVIFDCLVNPAVDGFTSLSGWFGVHCSIKRLFRLGCLILFCGVLHFVIHEVGRLCCGDYLRLHYGIEIQAHTLSYQSFRYWYLGAYLKLIVLSIAINPILAYISRMGRKWVVTIFAGFIGLSYLSLLWFPWESLSPRTVIFVYIVVRFSMMLGLNEVVVKSVRARQIVGVLLVLSAIEIAINAKWRWHGCANYGVSSIIAGILFVTFFSTLKISSGNLGLRLCKIAAPSMIAVYMLHWNLMGTFFKGVPKILMDLVPCLHPVFAFVVCAVCGLTICTLIDLVRRRCVDAFLPRLNAALHNFSRTKGLMALYEKRLS